MLILSSVSDKTLWGSTRLHSYGADKNNTSIGHLYTVTGNEDLSCIVLNGKYKNQTLYRVYKENTKLFGYKKTEGFPFMIAFVDANRDLSIQVHPDDAYAKKNENAKQGKLESWYFICPPTKGWIYNGTTCKTKTDFVNKGNLGKWNEILDTLPVKKGDYICVYPGTVHAITAGSFLYEIQLSSDITYRLYDFDRLNENGEKRELNQEKGFEAANPLLKSDCVKYRENREYIEKNYSTRLTFVKKSLINEKDVFMAVTLLEGDLYYENYKLIKGQSFIMLPGEKINFSSQAKVIIAYPI